MAGSRPTLLGAEGAPELVRLLLGKASRADITRTPQPCGQPMTLRLRHPDDVAGNQPRMAGSFQRYVLSLVPEPGGPTPCRELVLSDGTLLITAGTDLFGRAGQPPGVRVLDLGESGVTLHDADGSRPMDLSEETIPEVRHLRVVVDLGATPTVQGCKLRPPTELLRLHDAMFLTARACLTGPEEGKSFGIALLGGMLADHVPHPHAGLFTGFLKALKMELPALRAGSVVDEDVVPGHVLARLEAELAARPAVPAIYYSGGQRRAFRLRTAPAPRRAMTLTEHSVVVAAGGGRGIGAEMLKALTSEVSPRLYVLGSSPVPDDSPPPEDKADFIRERTAAGASVADANADFRRQCQQHELRANLRAMETHCGAGRVTYLRCDLRDAAAVRAAVEQINRETDGIDLLVNVAGINRSAVLGRKSLRDFAEVRDTKIDTYCNLKEAVAGRPPRVWHNTGSLTAFIGQYGETDYSSANDFLCTATLYAAAGGQDEYLINWGWWAEAGLAADPLVHARLANAGDLTPMPTAEGTQRFLAELSQSPHDPLTLVLGDNERAYFPQVWPECLQPARPAVPRFFVDEVAQHTDDSLAVIRTFGLDRDGYFRDHIVRGYPTLPGMVVIEVAVQAALQLVPARVPVIIENVRFDRFLRIYRPDRAERKIVRARLMSADELESVVEVQVLGEVPVRGAGGDRAKEMPHATMVIRLRDQPVPGPRWEPWPEGNAVAVTNPYYVKTKYAELRGIFASTKDGRLHPMGCRAVFDPDPDAVERWFPEQAVAPVLLDALAQVGVTGLLGGAWSQIAAPRTIRRIDLYGRHTDLTLARSAARAQLYSLPANVDLRSAPVTQAVAVGNDGRVIAAIKDMTGTVMGYLNQDTLESLPAEAIAARLTDVDHPLTEPELAGGSSR
jgi:NAD(P)-dependent dehydrogenase (short-subunit alcohol dehydrogenase family)